MKHTKNKYCNEKLVMESFKFLLNALRWLFQMCRCQWKSLQVAIVLYIIEISEILLLLFERCSYSYRSISTNYSTGCNKARKTDSCIILPNKAETDTTTVLDPSLHTPTSIEVATSYNKPDRFHEGDQHCPWC